MPAAWLTEPGVKGHTAEVLGYLAMLVKEKMAAALVSGINSNVASRAASRIPESRTACFIRPTTSWCYTTVIVAINRI